MVESFILSAARFILPDRELHNGALVIQNGRIIEVLDSTPKNPTIEVLAWPNATIFPGFVDIHVHGLAGLDTMDAQKNSFYTLSTLMARHGVTTFLPTTMTASGTDIQSVISTFKDLNPADIKGAKMPGLHIEGPYLNVQYCGAQDSHYIRRAQPLEYKSWFESGCIKLMTIAPEFSENTALIHAAKSSSIALAIGHSAASYEQAMDSFDVGITQATHTFNRMRGDLSRDPGVKVAVLNHDQVTAQIIVDDIHVHAANIYNLYKRKGCHRVALITDAIRLTGLADGDYAYGHTTVTKKGASATQADGALAGAVVPMDQAFRNLCKQTRCSFVEAAHMTSTTPANAIGLGNEIGRIQVGYSADLVAFDNNSNVTATLVNGIIVYKT